MLFRSVMCIQMCIPGLVSRVSHILTNMDSEMLSAMTDSYKFTIINRIEESVEPHGDCKIWTKSVKSSGYPQMKITVDGWGRRTLYVHRLVYMLEHGANDIQGKHISHICHNEKCCNIAHLSLEIPSVNSQRITCKKYGQCLGHDPYKACILPPGRGKLMCVLFIHHAYLTIVCEFFTQHITE